MWRRIAIIRLFTKNHPHKKMINRKYFYYFRSSFEGNRRLWDFHMALKISVFSWSCMFTCWNYMESTRFLLFPEIICCPTENSSIVELMQRRVDELRHAATLTEASILEANTWLIFQSYKLQPLQIVEIGLLAEIKLEEGKNKLINEISILLMLSRTFKIF